MNTPVEHSLSPSTLPTSFAFAPSEGSISRWSRSPAHFGLTALLAGLLLFLFGAPSASAQQQPPGCTGSGLGILLFTSAPDVHIGDTITYSVTVFNGTATGPIVCNADNITAEVTTPDGVSHPLTLVRTALTSGQSDHYPNVTSYVVRAQDIRSDGTVRATASDTGIIRQNDTPSQGGGDQGVNTEVSLPCIGLSAVCVSSVGESGLITFTGTVTNCGNNTLVGVTITNLVNGGQFHVTFVTNLARGAFANFSGSWIPLDPCNPSTATLVARGIDQFTTNPRTVTNSVSMTCQNVLTQGIKVTKECPPQPVAPGQLLTYSGSVSNTGNVTLINLVVVNNQPAANTPVFTLSSLAPGAVANFVGSYLAPIDCTVADTLVARAGTRCGVDVTDTVSATCPIATTPQIAMTANCPPTPVVPGSPLTYSGTVRNTGNITLTDVVVVSDRPAANTVVLTVASLAPGASANFTSSYTVPAGDCSLTTTFTGTGRDICSATPVTDFVRPNCAVATAPDISVVLNCPVQLVVTGGPITYTGQVRNSGNVTLLNVTVVNSQSVPATVLTVPSLAPNATAAFIISLTAPLNACSASTTVTVSGTDRCTAAVVSNLATATCPLVTAPAITVTQNCPPTPASPGGLLTYSGTVSNSGNITLTNVIVVNDRNPSTRAFTAATMAPGASANFTGSFTVPVNTACDIVSTLTAGGDDLCTGNRVLARAASTCPLLTSPAIAVTQACPTTAVPQGGLLTFSGTVRNVGNIVLTNIIVVNSWPQPNMVIFTAASLAPGATLNFTGSYLVPGNCCIAWITLQASGQGCDAVTVTGTDSGVCPVLTSPSLVVTKVCPPTAVRPGEMLYYSGTVSNSGNITLINVTLVNSEPSGGSPILGGLILAPGESIPYQGSYLVPPDFCGTDTVTARGLDACTFAPATGSVTTTCPIIITGRPRIAVIKRCPPEPTPHGGELVFSGTVSNPGEVTLVNVYVINNQPTNNTPVIGPISLAPGASVDFAGSYTVPEYCCEIIDTLIARGQDRCTGTNVTASSTVICPLLYTPGIALVQPCPPNPLPMGSVYNFSGFVTNTGDAILTNVVVFSNQGGQSQPLLGPLDLAPGEAEFYSGSLTVPFDTCAVTIFVTSQETCDGLWITNTTLCPIDTIPLIALTQDCPPTPIIPGGLVAYSGTVSNAGNITLTDVVVVNNRSGATPIFTAATLAPGAVMNFTGSYLAPAECFTTSRSTATGLSICGEAATDTVDATCLITTTPLIEVTQTCPSTPIFPGGLVAYSGTVSNAGNIALTNVVVLNDHSGATPVFTAATMAPGSVANFTGSYLAPIDCSTTSRSTATGVSICGDPVTDTVDATCPIITTPLIAITQTCPVTPILPGGTVTYSGTVSNAGNIALTDVVVVNDRSGATPIFTAASLAPGAVANFTGSYLAPIDCSTTSRSTATGLSVCGDSVTNSAGADCPITTAPLLAITQTCPVTPILPGGTVTYSGTVSNAGNIALTDVVVVNDRSGATPIFTAASLAPGAVANFTGSYLAPIDCSTTSRSTATGLSVCGDSVTDSASADCPITTAPLLAITQTCPVTPILPGGTVTYSGTVSNAGNIALTDVVVVNDRSGATPIFTAASLAPGAVANFTGSYLAPIDCSTTSRSTASGLSVCGDSVTNSASADCPITTAPLLAITQTCSVTPILPGGTVTYSGTVSNAGNIALTDVVVVNDRSGATPIFTAASLAPGAVANFTGSYLAPIDCSTTSRSTATGLSVCGDSVTDSASADCPITTAPLLAITQTCPVTPILPGGTVTYSGTVSNAGNVTLNTIVVTNSQSGNTPILSLATLAPGASAPFTGSYLAPATGPTTSTSTARATSFCGGPVVGEASSTCPIVTTSGIALAKLCPPVPVAPGGTLVYTGTVTNTGNVALTNVVVVNSQPAPNTPVLGPITLAPGAGTNFTGSYVVPLDACSVDDTLTVTGQDASTGLPITDTVSANCPLLTTPLLAVTQACPVAPVTPGSLLTYSGTVSNAGNITLNNIVVTNSQSGNTPILSLASLAPGVSANFTGSYLAPATGPTTSTSTARATSLCGGPVVGTASSTCPIVTTSGIALAKLCPPVPVAPGGTLVFTGTVTNTGNVALTNVIVVNSQPVPNTPVLGPITLAPGAGTNFTGSYVVPLDACSIDDTLTVTGQNASTGLPITDTISANCPLLTTPAIAITQDCPPGPVAAGDTVVFTGLVSNTGNITLTNVFVLSTQPSTNIPVLGPITLAPGASAPFTGSYLASGGSNPTTNTTIVTNSSGTITTNVASIVVTNTVLTVTTNNVTPAFGSIDPVASTMTDRFNVPAGLHGLMFADQDQNWGPTLFYSTRHPTSGADAFVTISTLAATEGDVTDRFNLTSTNYDALTLSAPDVGYGAVNFYYVRHDAVGASTFGVIKAAGASSSSDLWAIPNLGYNGLAFAEANLGYGANMFYFVRKEASGLSTFGTINPTPGGIALDRYPVGANFDALVFVPSAVSTWGTAIFAYLRHDQTGSIIGTIDPVTEIVTDRLILGTNLLDALTFTATDVGYGPNLFYYLRPERTILGTNVLTTFVTNTVTTFITNTVTTFTTNSVVNFTPTNTVIAVGIDICEARAVAAAADCLGPVPLSFKPGSTEEPFVPVLGVPGWSKGVFTLSLPTENGTSYTVQYKDALDDPSWIDLVTFVGTGEPLSIEDPTSTQQTMRFYRVISRP